LEAVTAFSQAPGVILVDGQGIAHPRRFGVACHLGILTGLPTIGCAKSRLLGSFREPGTLRGDWSPLEVEGETVGAVLRTQSGVKPVFVSPGHLVTLQDCIEIVLHCSTRYRVPEPLRMADAAARAARKEWLGR
jgi:deoxyribonuclease V